MKTLLIFMAVFSLLACVHGGSRLLKYKDVQFLKVIEKRSDATVFLEVSGLAFHSSLAVETIDTKIEDDCLVVYAHLVPARRDLSGNFLHVFNVPNTVDSVCFGPSKHLIWKRGVGIVER